MKLHESSFTSRDRLVLWTVWLRAMGVAPITGWRWRRLGWIKPLTLNRRLYLSEKEIRNFNKRAARGDFAKTRSLQANELPQTEDGR